MATSYTDGNILVGSFPVTFAGQTYVVNSFDVTVPSIQAERNDENGALAAKRNIDDLGRTSGTMEVQITVAADNQKLLHEEITILAAFDPSGADTVYVVEEESASVVVNESRIKTLSIRRLAVQPSP